MDFNQALRDILDSSSTDGGGWWWSRWRKREKYQERLITLLLKLLMDKQVITKEDAIRLLKEAKAAHQ